MSSLFKKLDALGDLLKQFNAAIKQPKMQGVKASQPALPKLPGVPSGNQKDPMKVAQQIKDAGTGTKEIAVDAAKQLKESYKTSKNGQWSINKADVKMPAPIKQPTKMPTGYHIHVNGQRITDKPLTRKQIDSRYGSVQRLEANGHRVVPHYE